MLAYTKGPIIYDISGGVGGLEGGTFLNKLLFWAVGGGEQIFH